MLYLSSKLPTAYISHHSLGSWAHVGGAVGEQLWGREARGCGGEGAGGGLGGGQSCTVAGRVGDVLGALLAHPRAGGHARYATRSSAHRRHEADALRSHHHGPLLLGLLQLALTQVVIEQLPLSLCQHLRAHGSLEGQTDPASQYQVRQTHRKDPQENQLSKTQANRERKVKYILQRQTD